MVGIIRKDLINIRKTLLISMLILIFSQMGILLQLSSGEIQASNSLFIILMFFGISNIGESIIDIDEKSNSENFYRIFPITSKDYIRAKYISILILDILMFILNSIIIYLSYKTMDAINITINLFLIFGIYSFLSFPLHLKYKNRALRIIVIVFFVLYVIYTYFRNDFNSIAKIFLNFNISLQVILAIFFALSFIIGKKITLKILEEQNE